MAVSPTATSLALSSVAARSGRGDGSPSGSSAVMMFARPIAKYAV